jgi:hypothetical protein
MAYSTIDSPKKYFDTKLYTGNGSTQSIGGLSFKPDFVWIKSRSSSSWWHQLQDIVRGATKRLVSNETVAEATDAQTLTSFDTDGFSLGTSTSYNNNSDTYVAWNWLAGGTGVSNTAGSISSTVSANTTSGFSIVSYTGTGANATVGHGLGVAPAFIIFKTRNAGYNWIAWTKAFATPTSQYLRLNLTDAVVSGNNPLNGTLPSSTVISLSSDNNVNESAKTYIAYCFAEVKGFSKAFSYTGNGSTDGSYVHLGFRPAWVLLKRTDSADHWVIKDSKRDSYNVADKRIYPNQSAAEDTSVNGTIDMLSNGFKHRSSNDLLNMSGGTYIGFAIAEQPFVSSKGIVANAR